MRIIKFRLVKDNKIISTQELKPNGIIDCPVEWDTAYQFTGLLDKQGKEIYEGDIIFLHTHTEIRMQVIWDSRETRFKLSPEYGAIFTGLFTETFYEVIGNIYESKYLLNNTDTKGGL